MSKQLLDVSSRCRWIIIDKQFKNMKRGFNGGKEGEGEGKMQCDFCSSSEGFDTFISCSSVKCQRTFHCSCIYPPLRGGTRLDRSRWKCKECLPVQSKAKTTEEKLKKPRRVKKYDCESCSRSIGYPPRYRKKVSTHISVASPSVEVPAESSRKARVNRRSFVSQLQNEDWDAGKVFEFNKLQGKTKHLRLGRSGIHAFGVFATDSIRKDEMVIEYIGELIRPAVADKRERIYESSGIGSSYLFRIDSTLIIDATFKGNLARFINHSCDPNCRTQVVSIGSTRHIVIYAKRDISAGEELAYDYKFSIEPLEEKIACHCGQVKCRGSMN